MGGSRQKNPNTFCQCVITSIGYKKGLGEIILVSLYFLIVNEKISPSGFSKMRLIFLQNTVKKGDKGQILPIFQL